MENINQLLNGLSYPFGYNINDYINNNINEYNQQGGMNSIILYKNNDSVLPDDMINIMINNASKKNNKKINKIFNKTKKLNKRENGKHKYTRKI